MVGAWCFGYCQAHQGLPVGFFCLVFSFIYFLSPYFWVISFLYLHLYVIGDDALISYGFFMPTKHLCVVIHIWTKGEAGALWIRFKPSSKNFTDRSKAVLLLWIIYVISQSCIWNAFVRVCLLILCGHLLGKGWPRGFRLWCLTVKLSLSHWYHGSDVVLDCSDSWSLPSFLLL